MNNNFKYVATIGVFSALIAIFSVVGVLMPFLSPFTMIINTICIVILSLKTGIKKALFAIPVSFVCIFLVSGNLIISILDVISFSFSGFMLAFCYKFRLSFNKTILLSTLAYLLYVFANVIILSVFTNKNAVNLIFFDPINEMKNYSISFLNQMKESATDQNIVTVLNEISKKFDTAFSQIVIFVPSIILISSTIWGYITLYFSKAILKRLNFETDYLPSFMDLRADKSFGFLLILTMIFSLFVQNETISLVLKNIIVIFAFIYIICGITLVDYFMFAKNYNNKLRKILVLLIILLAALIPYISMFLLVFGILDGNINFRKRLMGEA